MDNEKDEDRLWQNKIVDYSEDDIDENFIRATFKNEFESSWRVADCAIRILFAIVFSPKDDLGDNGDQFSLQFDHPFFSGYVLGLGEMFCFFNSDGVFGAETAIPAMADFSAKDRMESTMKFKEEFGCDPDGSSDLLGWHGVRQALSLLNRLEFPFPETLDLHENDERRWKFLHDSSEWYEQYKVIRSIALEMGIDLVQHLKAIHEIAVEDAIGENFDDELEKLLKGDKH